MIIGITGSFGSGKTAVANMFRKYSFKVINADKLYHDIYNKNKSLKTKIKKEFGTTNRNKIKKIVFNDYKRLNKLNKITHPIIINQIKKIINKKNNFVIDAPLLLESKLKNYVDKIIVVKCDKKTQINRILKKKKYTKTEINNILKSQMPLKEKLKHADFIIDNSKNLDKTKTQLIKILKNI